MDFKDVNTVSNAFADECFAKLAQSIGFGKFKSRTTFKNFNPFIAKIVKNAILERLAKTDYPDPEIVVGKPKTI
ncbi:STAS-like domain-containing protein [Peptococcaceae bacterium]|nr:STAS-like domain-containing protein [Peptococcaceae bacterium]